MVFKKYSFGTRALGEYGPDNVSLDVDLVSEQEIRILNNQIRRYMGSETEIFIDYPYVSPRQLCALGIGEVSSQLVIDIRKDKFDDSYQEILEMILHANQFFTSRNLGLETVDPAYLQLGKLMTINSYTENLEGLKQKAEYIKNDLFKDLPIQWNSYNSTNYGSAIIGKTKTQDSHSKIGLLLHMDTVHAPDVDMPVFQYKEKLFGSGAQDMQGSIYTVAQVCRKLHQQGELKNITIIINSAEEKGSPEYQEIFQKLANQLDFVMVYESSGEVVEASHPNYFSTFGLVTERKGIFTQGIRTIGPGGHSGVLTKKGERKNAISQAIQMMTAIDNVSDIEKETTVNLQYINGGQQKPMMAD